MYDKLGIALEIGLLSTIPQAFVCLFFALTFWDIRVERKWLRCAQYAGLAAVYFVAILLLPDWMRPFSLFGNLAVTLLLFREHPLRDRILVFATLAVMYNIVELPTAFILVSSGIVSQELLADDPRVVIPYLAIGNMLFALGAWLMHRCRLSPGKSIRVFLGQRKNRLMSGLVLLFVANVIISSVLFYYVMDAHPFAASYTLFATSIVSVLLVLFTIRSIVAVKNREIITTQETYVDEIENLFTTIRGQRHDFLNHVQVIQAFVRKRKLDDLERYVSELVGEIVEINDLLQIGHPALAAIVKSKMVYALDRKIDFRYCFEGMGRIGNGIASVDYVKIAGNLLDNALDEVLHRPPEERWVKIAGWTDEANIYLTVSNPVTTVTEEQKANMFRAGFTTKKEGAHSGLGLSIVKERVGHYHGELDVDTEADRVLSFRVRLPLRLQTLTS